MPSEHTDLKIMKKPDKRLFLRVIFRLFCIFGNGWYACHLASAQVCCSVRGKKRLEQFQDAAIAISYSEKHV